MKALVSLPVTSEPHSRKGIRLHTPADLIARTLPRIEYHERKGPLLHASPVADTADALSLNVTTGCAHRCAFCSVRANPAYLGDGVLQLDPHLSDRVAEEIAGRKQKPRAVYISPATDPFPPLREVQAQTGKVIEVLGSQGIESWLLTRGYIRPFALEALAAFRDQVKVTVGLTTLDRDLQRLLEPLAAPPRLRLRQLEELRALGVPVQAAIEPLLPGLTDTRENLSRLLEGLADAGVRRVTVGYLFMRQGIQANLDQALQTHGGGDGVFAAFTGGPVLEAGAIAPARYLPRTRRQRTYATIMSLAADLGITVTVSGTTNPDFRPPRKPSPTAGPRQRMLPMS